MSQRAARRARTKWEMKKWFRILAPRAFGFAELGLVPAIDEQSLLGRTIEVSFYDITKDVSQLPTKLKFQIIDVKDSTAYTQLRQIELTRDYIRSLVRRGTSRIDCIVDIETKEGAKLRVMGVAITQNRVKTSQKKAIRKIMFDLIHNKGSTLTFDELIQEIILGKVAIEIEMLAKKIYPLKKAEIRKVKVLASNSNIYPELT